MAGALRKLGSSEAAAQCCQAGQDFMDLHVPIGMGWPAPKIKMTQVFCWLQGCELTTVMPGGSALWISKFAFFLRMFSISLPFFENCCDHPGQKKIHKGFGQAWSLCIKGSHRRSGRLPVPLDTLWAGTGFESLLLEHLRVLFSCSVRKDIVNNLENQVCSPDS